jgi:SOS response regulatory protein OraA/RecX
MQCTTCNKENDADALFCENCGSVLSEVPRKGWRSYRYALLLLPVLILVAGAGYYKFILPNGVAAVVNGEEITLAELDRLIRPESKGADVSAETLAQMRYAALSELITERIVLQEAGKAGVRVSNEEVQAAIKDMRAASGLDDKDFATRINERYGSMGAFRKGLERRLVIRKFIDGTITAGASGPADANMRLNQWLKDSTAKAAVRVSLKEQLPASGCGCCGGKGTNVSKPGCDPTKDAKKGCDPSRRPAAGANQASVQAKAAQEAALAYWQQRNGTSPVETKVTDFGCHIQVDIVANNKITKSVRYQNGTITEM